MKNLILSLCFLSNLWVPSSAAISTSSPEEEAIRNLVHTYVEAIEYKKVQTIDKLLHKEFRLLTRAFPGEDYLTIISKEIYLNMLGLKQNRGIHYELRIKEIEFMGPTATVIIDLVSPHSILNITLLCIRGDENNWQIVSDLRVIQEISTKFTAS